MSSADRPLPRRLREADTPAPRAPRFAPGRGVLRLWPLAAMLLTGGALVAADAPPPPADADAPAVTIHATPEDRRGWSDDERAAWADALREAYARDPADWPEPTLDPGVPHHELGLLPDVPHPPDNPYREPVAELGEKLFFDPRLSGSNQLACASCHDPDLGWGDGRAVSFGHRRTELARNAPSVLHSGYYHGNLFWDGRSDTLEQLVLSVIANVEELSTTPEAVAEKLGRVPEYDDAFAEAFGSPGVTPRRIAESVAMFVRTVNGGRSRFDAFLRGRADALPDAAVRGLHLFRTDARCLNCHSGPILSDSAMHVTGLHLFGRPFEDLGRYGVTRDPADSGAFKTPTLRHIARTGPYMHHGLFESLIVTLRAYNGGMPSVRVPEDEAADPRVPVKSPLIQPLGLSDADLSDLEAFLESLTEPSRRVRPPELPPFADDRPAAARPSR